MDWLKPKLKWLKKPDHNQIKMVEYLKPKLIHVLFPITAVQWFSGIGNTVKKCGSNLIECWNDFEETESGIN